MRPVSENQRPDLLTYLMNMTLVLRLPREMHLCRSSANVPPLPSFLEMLQNPHVLLTFGKVQNPLRLTQNHIWTFKSGPSMWCFYHFDLETRFTPQRHALFRHLNFQKWSEPGVFCTFWLCFAPQRRALFRHLNFQKWSENGVLWTFWLPPVLRATPACNFSSLIWPHGSAPAALASLLFDPPGPQIIGKTQCFGTTFSRTCIFFLLTLLFSDLLSSVLLFSDSSHLCLSIFCSSLLSLFSPLLFHLSILSEVWLQNFLR